MQRVIQFEQELGDAKRSLAEALNARSAAVRSHGVQAFQSLSLPLPLLLSALCLVFVFRRP
jgi:hypothetical protein